MEKNIFSEILLFLVIAVSIVTYIVVFVKLIKKAINDL